MKKHILFGLLALGLSLGVSAQASRIVTVGGTVTEIVFALGKGSSVVGVDTSSLYPAASTGPLPKVGYIRALAAEGVLSLAPTLIITTVDAGPPAALEQIRSAGVPVVVVPAGASWEASQERINFLGNLLGASEKAAVLTAALQASQKKAEALVAARKTKPRVLFVYARGAGTMMVSGKGTEADAVIALAGGVNAVTGYDGYRPLTPEALAAARPDLLLFTSGGLQSLGGKEGLNALPAFVESGLAKARVGALDDLLLLGFGPRLGEAVESLQALLP